MAKCVGLCAAPTASAAMAATGCCSCSSACASRLRIFRIRSIEEQRCPLIAALIQLVQAFRVARHRLNKLTAPERSIAPLAPGQCLARRQCARHHTRVDLLQRLFSREWPA
eukprot:7126691-Prymnesium_polylepis.1